MGNAVLMPTERQSAAGADTPGPWLCVQPYATNSNALTDAPLEWSRPWQMPGLGRSSAASD